jgi:hypothetical protein
LPAVVFLRLFLSFLAFLSVFATAVFFSALGFADPFE